MRKIRNWFKTKKEMIELLERYQVIFDEEVQKIKREIIPLEQGKTYHLSLKGATAEEQEKAAVLIKSACMKLEWTAPPIIVTNAELKEKKKGGRTQ